MSYSDEDQKLIEETEYILTVSRLKEELYDWYRLYDAGKISLSTYMDRCEQIQAKLNEEGIPL